MKSAFWLLPHVLWLLPILAWGAPAVGPEFDLGPATYVAAAYGQVDATIAFNGTNYLVVWADNRDAGEVYIYGTRVSLDGQVLDPEGIRIQSRGSTLSASHPVAISDGCDFMVFWNVNVSGTVCGTRVLGDGTVMTNEISFVGGDPAIAFSGTNYFMTWTKNADIYGQRLDRNGTILDPGGFPICTVSNSQYASAIAQLGENWLVAWTDQRREGYNYGHGGDVYGALVSPTGTVLTTNGFVISATNNFQGIPRLSSLGNTCLVTWYDERKSISGGNYYVYGARVNAAGTVLEPQGFAIGSWGQNDLDSYVATDGQNWVVAWAVKTGSYSWQIDARQISPQGVPSTEYVWGSISLPAYVSPPALIWGASNYFGVWTMTRGDQYAYDIVGSRISPAGAAIDTPHPISLSINPQIQPAAAGDGTNNYLVVWTDGRRGDRQWDIYGARVSAKGQVLDPGGFPITASSTAETNPAVAFDGSRYLVVWVDSRSGYQDIYGARVNLDGTVLETNGFVIANTLANEISPAVASNGKGFLVAWGAQNGLGNQSIACSRISDSGQILDKPALTLMIGSSDSDPQPKVASDGTNFFVTGCPFYCGAVMVSGLGTILYSNMPVNVGYELASNGRGFLSLDSGPYGITGHLFNEGGTLVTNFTVATTFYNYPGYSAAVASDSKDYLMAFSTGIANDPFYVGQISGFGRVFYTNSISSVSNGVIALAANKNNFLLLCLKQNHDSPVPRVYCRVLDESPLLAGPAIQDEQFTLTLDGMADRVYEIQASPDLQEWATVCWLTNQSGHVQFSNSIAGYSQFYRTRTE